MSMGILFTVHWHGDAFFITDEDEIWRVWIGGDYHPLMERLTPFQRSEYSWPVAHLRGLVRAKDLPMPCGHDDSHRDQGSNYNPRGWGRR